MWFEMAPIMDIKEDMCFSPIKITCSNFDNHPTLNSQCVWEAPCEHLKSKRIFRASPMVMDLHLHLHFFIRDAYANPRMRPSGPCLY